MFFGHGALDLDGDHLDLSYRDPDAWPSMTPGGAIKTFMFDFGDPVAGPVAQLALIRPVAGDEPNWDHIDPVHFHGSDQFRLVPGGEWMLAGKPMVAGHYAFQESGRIYREHGGPANAAWLVLVVGDRRGIRPTIVREGDLANMVDTAGEYGRPLGDGEVYPHPAGPAGKAAVATTAGPCRHGYLRGAIADLPATLSGAFGDETAGPVAHVIRYGPGELAAPASVCATERFIVVAEGSCRIGAAEYRAGDMRIQRADRPMEAMVSGPDGLAAAIVVADRRAETSLADAGGRAEGHWMFAAERLSPRSTPAPRAPTITG